MYGSYSPCPRRHSQRRQPRRGHGTYRPLRRVQVILRGRTAADGRGGGVCEIPKKDLDGGAGVHVGGIGISNTFNMNGGTISGNTSSGSGGGVSVYLYNATTQYSFLITGGSIKENEANNNGAGVNIRQNSGTGIFSVGGTATITDNMKGTDEQNVYLEKGVEILLGTGANAYFIAELKLTISLHNCFCSKIQF